MAAAWADSSSRSLLASSSSCSAAPVARTSVFSTRASSWATAFFAVSPLCRARTKSPSPTSDSRLRTTSSAAAFSLTNRTLRPACISAAIMFVMVWLLPVPGGPLITNERSSMAAAMHCRCEASASRTSGVRSGTWSSSIRSRAGGSNPIRSSGRPASGPSPMARISGLARMAASFSLRSWYIASLWEANRARTTPSSTAQPR